MKNLKTTKPKAANDNRHDQFHWEFMYTYLDFWLKKQKIDSSQWPYNRSIHYMYELTNRPWLSLDERQLDVVHWMHTEAKLLGVPVRYLDQNDLSVGRA